MTHAKLFTIVLLTNCLLGCADEIADIDDDGHGSNRPLTSISWATARGSSSFLLDDPMESRDYAHVSRVESTLLTHIKMGSTNSSKLASLEESLRPLFSALPKDSAGRLDNGTARYALHRLFTEAHGWSIKGLQPAAALWITGSTMNEDVKDINKYMVPTYLQDQLLSRSGVSSFDLHNLAILAATLEHMILAETMDTVYSVYKALELPLPGKKKEQQVVNILDTFMMVYVFGLNLDVSNLDDVTRAKLYLDKNHPGWPHVRAFTQDIKRSIFVEDELDFDDIMRVVNKIEDKYAEWRGKSCSLVQNELSAKPSYSKGAVSITEIVTLIGTDRREMLNEPRDYLATVGALREHANVHQLIVPNYINSQSMCLSTSSLYAVCCRNECEGLLAKIERDVRAPVARPEQIVRSMKALLPREYKALESLKDIRTGLVQIHSRLFADWMHRTFPLECPSTDATRSQRATNPMTPNAWMHESHLDVSQMKDMLRQAGWSLAHYTYLGRNTSYNTTEEIEEVGNSTPDIMKISHDMQQNIYQEGMIPSAVQFAAAASLAMLGVTFMKSGLGGHRCGQHKRNKETLTEHIA